MTEERFCDTNALMDYSEEILNTYDKVYIPGYVLGELDKHKSQSIDLNKQFKAREAGRNLEKYEDKVEYIIRNGSFSLPIEFSTSDMDNKILSVFKDFYTNNPNVIGLSNDLLFREKCKLLELPCEKFGSDDKSDVYKGYKELFLDTDSINILFDQISKGINEYGFLINEYLILHNTDLKDLKSTSEYRFNGEKFVDLKLPDSKIIKGKNSPQRCALDLLFNKDIPIKIIAGGFGSGKTMTSVKVGLHHVVDKGTYKNLMFLRNPIVTDGAEIGFLPGDKSEKIYDFCRPFLQYIESEKDQVYAETLVKNEKIKMDVVSFLKGVSIDDSFVIMDEAEDLNTKLIRLVGSRIGEKSCIVFTGDWKQSEHKYKIDNGLLKLIKEGQGSELVGIVVLEEDLRSPASKIFAELK